MQPGVLLVLSGRDFPDYDWGQCQHNLRKLSQGDRWEKGELIIVRKKKHSSSSQLSTSFHKVGK